MTTTPVAHGKDLKARIQRIPSLFALGVELAIPLVAVAVGYFIGRQLGGF